MATKACANPSKSRALRRSSFGSIALEFYAQSPRGSGGYDIIFVARLADADLGLIVRKVDVGSASPCLAVGNLVSKVSSLVVSLTTVRLLDSLSRVTSATIASPAALAGGLPT